MNILPKKRWHVRTKDNIARVRRDEAAAQEEEKKRLDKKELAESEARINYLRSQSDLPETVTRESDSTAVKAGASQNSDAKRPFDLFADYKSHVKKTNKDLEKEKKDEQEKYEKQIGYLTYLGQDTNEALKVHSWYEVAPKRFEIGNGCNFTETNLKQKLSEDPLTLINALIPSNIKKSSPHASNRQKRTPTPEPSTTPTSVRLSKSKKHKTNGKRAKKDRKPKKHKSHKHNKSTKELTEIAKRDKLNRLRKERLLREATEKRRQEQLFSPKEPAIPTTSASTPAATPRIVQKYNSQFNPELAKQNMK